MRLFNNVPSPAVDVVKRTIEVKDTEDGTIQVSFHTARGRGTSPVTMSVEQYDDFVSALAFYSENGISEDRTPAEMVHQSISSEDGVVTFRTRTGKGSRPTRIPAEEFSAVVGLLQSVSDGIRTAADTIAQANTNSENTSSDTSTTNEG